MSTNKKTLLQLEDFYLTQVDISWGPLESKSDSVPEHSPDLDFDFGQLKDSPCTFIGRLDVRVPPLDSNPNIKIHSSITGIFTWPDKDSVEQHASGIIPLNAAIILYGILRGEIAQITGSFPDGKVNLPTVDMANYLARNGTEDPTPGDSNLGQGNSLP